MKRTRMSKSNTFTIITTALLVLLAGTIQSAKGQRGKLEAVPFTDVVITDKFWAPRIETNWKVTIPYAFKKCEETGRISNFAKAGGLMEGKHEGIYFNDSDVYKVIEGAAYSLKSHPDQELEKYVDGVIDKIAAAQWEDGYLYTFYSLPQHQPEKRWTNTRKMHELYCAGHFFEAAVAHYQATGKDKMLNVAVRLADYIDSVFGPDKKRDVPGHEEIEIGLVKLYRQTGNEKYLKLAKFFLDERGHARGRELYGQYCQDHKPIVEQSEAVGHAVRAGYLYCGIADVAALTGDADYIKAIDRIWENVVTKKLYLTGGIGARHKGESFGDNYELPNATAYNETCAAIANAMWNHRMFLLHADAKYIDVLERVIYNGFPSGISLSGDKFFYPNPLESDGKKQRSPWFGCACCPTNIVRFLPTIGGYAYAKSGDALYVNLFITSDGSFKLKNNTVKLKQLTRYPWEGDIKITVEPKRPEEFSIYVRVPSWAQNQPVPSDLYKYMKKSDEKVTLKVNGGSVAPDMEKGFARIRRKWKKGDVIELNLPIPIQRVFCKKKVKENLGKVALERGPIVYCVEEVDNDPNIRRLVLSADAQLKPEYRKDLLGGVCVISGKVFAVQSSTDGKPPTMDRVNLVAIPYYAWSHRGEGEMAVWLARNFVTALLPQD
ncbi:MAG: glycoside hydrolase family 127 protein [Planctomycetota bacterium]